MENQKIRIPKIGMRITKTAIAVFLCFIVYMIRGEGLPFYSTISAVLCMQPCVSSTVKAARNRTIATFIGGIFGLGVLIFQRAYFANSSDMVLYLITSIAIIPTIYAMILSKYRDAIPTSCIVFLSIAVNHAADVNPIIFAMNRVIDTLIGIFVALGVNSFHLPRKRNTEILFVTELKGVLLDSLNHISSFTKVTLRELINDGAKIVLSTEATPGDLVPALSGINIKEPIITMNGAALYDWSSKTYLYCENIDYNRAKRIEDIIRAKDMNSFTHTIINDVLHIYYGRFKNDVQRNLYNSEKLVPMKNYIFSFIPEDIEVVNFTVIDTLCNIEDLCDTISREEFNETIKLEYKPIDDDYYVLKIYSSKVSKERALEKIKATNSFKKVITFGDLQGDISLFNKADSRYVIGRATEGNKEIHINYLKPNDINVVAKTMRKLFYVKKLNK